MFKNSTRLATFGALTAAFTLSGCGLSTRVVRTSATSGSNASSAAPTVVTQSFTATDKMDLLITVDPSNLTDSQQKQIKESIDQVISKLDNKGVDFHVGLVGAGGAPVSSFPIPLPFPIPGLGGNAGNQSDWLSAGLGALTQLSDNDRFLTHGQRSQFQGELLEHLTQGIQNKLGSSTRAKFQQSVLPLLPIVVKAAQGGASQKDMRSIYTDVAPLVLKAVNQGQLGGNYSQAINSILPIIQTASGSGTNNQKFDSIVAALLPIAINVGLQSQGANPYVQAASILLPSVLQLADKAQKGATFDELMGSIIPIVLSQVGNSQSGQYLTMISLALPMVNSVLGNLARGRLDPRALLSDMLPIAFNAISSQGASSEYTYLLSAVMPVVMNIIQDQKMGNDPNKLLATVSQLGLATVLGAVDKGKMENGGVNQGFLRDDAILSVLMIGEKVAPGAKQDPKELATSFINILLDSKSGAKEKVAFDAILGGSTNICSSQLATSPNVYKEIAALTNGSVADLCNNPNKFGDMLSSSVLSKLTEYSLDQAADQNTIHVLIDGLEVPQGAENGWSVSGDGKHIKLNGSYIPSASSEIEVQYVAAK